MSADEAEAVAERLAAAGSAAARALAAQCDAAGVRAATAWVASEARAVSRSSPPALIPVV